MLVDLVWEERRANVVGYVAVDPHRRVGRLEALAPAPVNGGPAGDLALDAPPFPALLAAAEPVVLLEAPAWLRPVGQPMGAPMRGVVVSAPTRVRDTTTGVLLAFYGRGPVADLEEDRRVLALIAASAALALDAARSQAREEVLATLRHDINNPVHAALGYTEMILDRLRAGGDGETLALAASVLDSLKVVADLVSNYLHMAAIDRGVPALHHERLDLGTLAAEIVERFRPSAVEKQVRIVCRGHCPTASADRRQLGRVITNLVSNAVKYTPGPGQVEVRVGEDEAGAMLEVADTGYGLAPDELPLVFTKYARFHRERGLPGTGLGLYISRAIVEAHGGTITVTSIPGHGATFTVRLPR